MPRYEYLCLDCKKPFEKILTLAEHEKEEKMVCPHCGSQKVAQQATPFFPVTSRKAA